MSNTSKVKRVPVTIQVSTLEAALLDAEALLTGTSRSQLAYSRVFSDKVHASPFLALLATLQRIARELAQGRSEASTAIELSRCIKQVEMLVKQELARM